MERQVLTDGSGSWFDVEKAELFKENTTWSNGNTLSVATRDQWDHEYLYRTAGGRWVLNEWSQRQNITERWTCISSEKAAIWLIENGHSPPCVADIINSLEI